MLLLQVAGASVRGKHQNASPRSPTAKAVYIEMAAIIKCSSRHAEVFRHANYHFSGVKGSFKGERVENMGRISIENRIVT